MFVCMYIQGLVLESRRVALTVHMSRDIFYTTKHANRHLDRHDRKWLPQPIDDYNTKGVCVGCVVYALCRLYGQASF